MPDFARLRRRRVEYENRVHFHGHAQRKRGHADGGASREGLIEVTRHDFIDVRAVGEIRQVDGELRDIRQRASSRLRDCLEVFENALDLLLDRPIHNLHRGGVERNLAREVNGLAGLNRLRIAPNRLWRGIRLNTSSSHGEDTSRVEARCS